MRYIKIISLIIILVIIQQIINFYMADVTIYKMEIKNICKQINRVYEQSSQLKLQINTNKNNYTSLSTVIKEKINTEITESTLRKLLNNCDCENLSFRDEILDDFYYFISGKKRKEYMEADALKQTEYMNTEYQATKILIPDYEKLQIDVEQELIRTIEVRKGQVEYFLHWISVGNLAQMKYEDPIVKDFEILELPDDIKVKGINKKTGLINFSSETKQKIQWTFEFSRPLKEGEKLRYRIVLSYKNAHSFSWEDFEKARQDKIVAKKKRSEAHSLVNDIMQEMQTSRLTLKFEKGYFVNDEYLSIYRSDIQDLPQSIKNRYTFTAKSDHLLEFKSDLYLPQSTYAIFWSPPSVKQLLEKKLITPVQAQKIYDRTQ